MPLSTIFQLYHGDQFYWWRKLEYPVKTTDISQVADKLNFITLCCIGYTSPLAGFELTTLVVICTDCTGSCKSNYHTTMTAPVVIDTDCTCMCKSNYHTITTMPAPVIMMMNCNIKVLINMDD